MLPVFNLETGESSIDIVIFGKDEFKGRRYVLTSWKSNPANFEIFVLVDKFVAADPSSLARLPKKKVVDLFLQFMAIVEVTQDAVDFRSRKLIPEE